MTEMMKQNRQGETVVVNNVTSRFRVAVNGVLLLVVALFFQPSIAQQARIIPRAPEIAGSSYILIDATTGEILVEHDSDLALPPASLTKIMTSYIAATELSAGNISFDDEVPVSVKAWRTEGSKMFIQEGTTVRLEDILRGIIIQSGNDASIALAEHIAGSEDAFADMMNQHAQALGMENSYFINASGLPADQHVMSARDLSTLAMSLIQNYPEHYSIYGEKEFTFNDITQSNRNTLLFADRNVDGMKTGFTDAAGYCLVASATRGEMRLIAVVMGTSSPNARTIEAQKLLTYGFRFFETYQLYNDNQVLSTSQVWSGKSNSVDIGIADGVMVTIPRGDDDRLNTELVIDGTLKAPIELGQVMGQVTVSMEDKIYYQGPVVAMTAVERGNFIKRLMDFLQLFFLNLFS